MVNGRARIERAAAASTAAHAAAAAAAAAHRRRGRATSEAAGAGVLCLMAASGIRCRRPCCLAFWWTSGTESSWIAAGRLIAWRDMHVARSRESGGE